MTELYDRKIRIENCHCPDKLPNGEGITIKDAMTGERINNIASVDIHLTPTELNIAELTYYEADETGQLRIEDGKPVEHRAIAKDPDVRLTTFARTIGHPQAIMNIAQKALNSINNVTDSVWPYILVNALEDIITRCKACLKENSDA